MNGKSQKSYFSVLVKGGDKWDEVWKKNTTSSIDRELCISYALHCYKLLKNLFA